MKNLLIFLLTITINQVFACECKTYPVINGKTQHQLFVEDSFDNATVIFYGKYNKEGRFEVKTFYRGEDLNMQNKIIEEKQLESTCDYFFTKGQNYLVYGKFDELGKLHTSVCYANIQVVNEKQLLFIKNHI